MDFLDSLIQGTSTNNGESFVSGTNVKPDTEEDFDLNALMADVNSANIELQQTQDEASASAIQAAEDADRKAREEARARLMAQKAEEERKERERLLAIQQEEEQKLAEEMAAKQQANPLNKLAGMFSKPKKNEYPDAKNNNEEENCLTTVSEETKPEAAQPADEVQSTSSVKVENKSKTEKSSPVPKKELKKPGFKKPEKNKTKSEKDKPKVEKNSTKDEKPDFEYLATHDSLTKLLNRTAFDMKISTLSADKLTVIFVDINNLKKTNDTYGHEFGNKLIVATAEKLAELFPNCVYRIGGDEFIVLVEDVGSKVVDRRIEAVHAYLKKRTSDDKDGLIYAVAVGYAVGDGKKTLMQLQEEADKAMYENKAKYKKEHPEQNGRPEEETPQSPEDYDELLNKEQRELKEIVREGHIMADEDKTERILAEVQSRYQEVLAIFIADAEFNSLYIIRDVRNFLTVASEMEDMIDYSYIYVVYEGGPQYYGADDYMTEITHIFEEVTNNLRYNRSLNNKELAKIPGINIFKNIYFDC